MTNYVADYRRNEDNAARDESQAEQYRKRADEYRWEQCRIAHEATVGGEYSQTTFAKMVGKSQTTISSQAKAWRAWGDSHANSRPSYEQAMNEAKGDSTEQKIARSAATHIRRLPAEDKAKLAAELLDDPDVEVAPSTIAKHAARPDVARAIARNDEAREAVEEEAIEHRARFRPDDLPDPREAGRRAGAGMARRMETDAATLSLRQAAGIIAEAVFEREQFGIEYPEAETEALNRVERAVALYLERLGTTADINDDDRAFLESIGVQS